MGTRNRKGVAGAIELGLGHIDDAVSDQERSRDGESYNHLRPIIDDGDYDKYRRSNNVQKVTIFLVSFMFVLLIILVALASESIRLLKRYNENAGKVTVVYPALGLPKYEGYSWNDVLTAAAGESVNFYMWSGDDVINGWVNGWLKPKLSENYGINLKLVGLNETSQAVDTIKGELAQGWTTNGTVDLVWINGDNFYTAKTNGYLYDSWATKLPNSVNFDFNSDIIKYDFGTPTNGDEFPYNKAQVVFIYNTKNITTPPQTIPDLVAWCKKNPGKFTYAFPPNDFTGSVLIRHFLYAYASPYSQFLGDFNQKLYNQKVPAVFKVLRDLEPYLYQKHGAAYYPFANDEVDELFGAGKILITVSYDPAHAAAKVDKGEWNKTVQSYVLSTGTISNTNFVAIGTNAKNKLAALVAANFIGSFEAMFERSTPESWGALQAYNPTSTSIVESGWTTAFDYINRSSITPSISALNAASLGELSSAYVDAFASDWGNCVVNYTTHSTAPQCKV